MFITRNSCLTQDGGGSGITATEIYHQYINTKATNASTYASQNFPNYYDSDNFQLGTFTYYFEATLKNNGGTSAARLTPGSLGAVNGAASYTLSRSASSITPVDNSAYDTEIQYADVSTSWLIIQVTSLEIPEKIIFLIPVAIFLPKIISFAKRKLALRKSYKIKQIKLP